MRAARIGTVVAVVLVTVPMIASTLRADPPCVVAANWVASNGDNLPTTYDELAEFDNFHRSAIVAALPLDVRTSLWQEHGRRFLAAHPELTPVQIEFVHSQMEAYRSYAAMKPTDPALPAATKRAIAVLGKELTAQAFGRLGEPASDSSPAAVVEECSCSDSSDFCGINFDCDFGAECEVQAFTCGWLGVQICDGLCEFEG